MNEKVYYIPKNLNTQWLLLGLFTIADAGILLITFCIAVASVVGTGHKSLFIPWVVLAVLRLHYDGYSMFHHLMARLQYILNYGSRTYILFEKERNNNGND